MDKASLTVEQLKKKEKQLGKTALSQLREGEKFNHLLDEFWRIEQSFAQNAEMIAFIFQQLHKCYPAEPIFEQYDHELKTALPHFKNFSAHFKAIVQDSTLDGINKIGQIATLYCSDMYEQSLIHLALLYRQFELWGGEFEYEKWMQKSRQFSAEMIKEAHDRYSPLIFIQRLPQLSLMAQELAKQTADLNIQSLGTVIKGRIEAIQEKMGKSEAIEEITDLLSQENEADIEVNQKKAVQLFIENRLYMDSELYEVDQKIKHYYFLYFQEILLSIFKRIEEVKIKMKRKSSQQLELFHSELKERLLRYLEYSNNFGFLAGFEPWTHLANIVLVDAPLSGAALKLCIEQQPDNKKLALMKCFADFLQFIKEHGNEKMARESQEAMELMLQR